MPIRAGIRGQGLTDLRIALRTLAPFTTSGALRGERVSAGSRWFSGGDLPKQYLDELRAAAKESAVQYVVFSYETPIAWVSTGGTVTIPPVKYSQATTIHQGFLWQLGKGV